MEKDSVFMPKKVQLGKILLQQTTIFQKNFPKNKKKIVKKEEAKAKNIFNRNHSQTKSFAINNKRHTNQQTARSTPQFPPTKNQKPENVEHSIIPTQSTNPKKKTESETPYQGRMDGKEAGHGQKTIDAPKPFQSEQYKATQNKGKIAPKISQRKGAGSGRRTNRQREIKMRGTAEKLVAPPPTPPWLEAEGMRVPVVALGAGFA